MSAASRVGFIAFVFRVDRKMSWGSGRREGYYDIGAETCGSPDTVIWWL